MNSHILKSYAQVRTMLFDYCRAQADTAAGDVACMDRSMLGKGKGKKGKGDKKGKGKGKSKKSENSKDEKERDEDKKGKGKGKNNIKAEYFAGYFNARGWGHTKKDCWWNENAESGKDTASLETPITPAENTKTEPPNTGMLIQPDEGDEIPADDTQWMYAVTKQESVPNINDFLIDCGAATSVCQQSLADSLGGKPRGPGVELRSATGHQFTATRRFACAHVAVPTLRATFRSRPRTQDCRDQSYLSDKCATEATSSRSAVQVERCSTSSLATALSLSVLVACFG